MEARSKSEREKRRQAEPRNRHKRVAAEGVVLGAQAFRGAAGVGVLRSASMLALYRETECIARSDLNVLILGETGVGKDVLARAIHDRSARARQPFLRLNCAALPEALLESELFGYQKGAFTGASATKVGLLQSASGGSVFLDEIGELSPHLQAKLLQVLETKEILGLGCLKATRIDVRFLAATNRDLEAEIRSRKFRADLRFRIAGYTAPIPPLRERREDILPLVQEFLRYQCAEMGRQTPLISDDALRQLLAHTWPGNVRELRNVVERALVLSEDTDIGPEHLPREMRQKPLALVQSSFVASEDNTAPVLPIFDLSSSEIEERKSILAALASAAGNQSRAAQLLGVSRSTLLNRLDAYRIRRPRKRPG